MKLQVVNVSAVVTVAVQADDGVEEVVSEGQRARLGLDQIDLTIQISLSNPFPIFSGFDPEVCSPDFNSELFSEEYGTDGLAAPHVRDAHARLQRHHTGQRLRQPDDVRPH